MTSSKETYKPAFSTPPPHISYGLPFHEACAHHVKQTFKADRPYIIASGSLSRNTDNVEKLKNALEATGALVAGIRKGMTPHTLWSEILEVVRDCREMNADLIVTLGAGSLTDAAKIVALVRLS